MNDSDNFYQELKAFTVFDQFTDLSYYQQLPSDWLVVITDIQGSTKAIQDGRYKEVNALGAASIVAMLNAVKPLKIPYVFGGDGATVCVPLSKSKAIAEALVAAKQMAEQEFKMSLRIGMVPLSRIQEQGHHVSIGKFQAHADFQQAMFQGDGLSYAESLVKDPAPDNPYLIDEHSVKANASFEGFECRWDEIPSPHEETVALLIQVTDEYNVERIYSDICKHIFSIYGLEDQHHPVREETLRLTKSPKKLSSENRIRSCQRSWFGRIWYRLKLPFVVTIGQLLMAKGVQAGGVNWGNYKNTLIANTDYRKFDEVLRMILSGTEQQRKQLRSYLSTLHSEQKIVFGIHHTGGALITCLINNYDNDHVHFLDASDGGYAMAAKEMKQQIKALASD